MDLTPLTHGTWIWLDGEALARYIRGTDPSASIRLVHLTVRGANRRGDKSYGIDGDWTARTNSGQRRSSGGPTKTSHRRLEEISWVRDGPYPNGRVSLEYEYQLALARLRARHPGLEIEEDPFTLLPEDADMPMADDQPFDGSPPILEE
ncbi:hypothetical protein BHE74_00027935 [Ensete ventricosum]|nr:hypothetical protein GW17_00040846 [Ensete ventricosum]RWW64802.1 hypothetical protein BHE74_00027935 [Ensete ventricosum]RZS08412.1 hypothetical protein BHM03_00039382 [Ensete ventricosum]